MLYEGYGRRPYLLLGSKIHLYIHSEVLSLSIRKLTARAELATCCQKEPHHHTHTHNIHTNKMFSIAKSLASAHGASSY